MMLARVADSLYWIGRYTERAEHVSRLGGVMLHAALDRGDAAAQAARIALAAVGEADPAGPSGAQSPGDLALNRDNHNSVVSCIAGARENARQVRDQITTETWERLNMLYLRITGDGAQSAFGFDAPAFFQDVIADLHLFKGAADATMSHGEGWRFMVTGAYIERAQLIARLLRSGFDDTGGPALTDHVALMNVLRMACALEPYLRCYTADIRPRFILEFLLFDRAFPRSIRFSTARIEEHLTHLSRGEEARGGDPLRLAGRLNARLSYADEEDVENHGAGPLLAAVGAECDAIHRAIHEAFVAHPHETRAPA